MMRRKRNKTVLVGRDPTKGLLAFKTGIIFSRKSRALNRKSKIAKRLLRRALES